MPNHSPDKILANMAAIAATLSDPTKALDAPNIDLLTSTLEHPNLSREFLISLEPSTLKTASSAGVRLSEILHQREQLLAMFSDPRIAIDDPKVECLGEIQAILREARPLKRLDVISRLLSEENELSFSLNPICENEIGQWGMIYGHSHHLLNRCVSGQILAESGLIKISTFISDSPYANNAFCYLVSISSSYSPNKTLEILINADPENAARGQVADWTGPLYSGLGVFYSDPYLGGRYLQSTMNPRTENGEEWKISSTDPATLENRMAKQLRNFTHGEQENMADLVLSQILKRAPSLT